MSTLPIPPAEPSRSRRDFVGHVAQLGAAAAIAGCASAHPATTAAAGRAAAPASGWDLSWVARIGAATDRAVFDAAAINEGTVLDLATRYLDNCDAVYGAHGSRAVAVLNFRTRAVALGLTSAMWERYALGAQYDVKDPLTKQPATRNPFLDVAPGAYPGTGSINALVRRGAVLLVCDFALGHLSNRLAASAGRAADEVHRDLRAGFVPGAFAVPSGIYGMAKAQNAGCALVTM